MSNDKNPPNTPITHQDRMDMRYVVCCSDCRFIKFIDERRRCVNVFGLNRNVAPGEFCSWGELND